MTAVGIQSLADAISLWNQMPETRQPATAANWLRTAIRLVMTRRRYSRDLALAYYRLARALRTGTTIANPRKPEPRYITLDVLRDEFIALANPQSTPPPAPDEAEPAPDEPNPVDDSDTESDSDDADRILVEEIEELEREQARIEAEAEREAAELLLQLGPLNLNRKTHDLDTSQPADVVDEQRDDAHQQAGRRQAATLERLVMNGGRSTTWSIAARDKRALGWARVSKSGTPCGWCAMLISRGAVYRSEQSALFSDGDKYHDNCHCDTVIVFTAAQFESPRFDLNREYAELWPEVTKGLNGKAALKAWRTFIRRQQRAQAAQPTNAQEAAT
ncbi:VG15 protein [Kribbella deserti]|uniref:Capsid maturation protease n=1 Tax=Kribbella deserti TaxID=1926257 RepID=A0ABV6QE41_9ACTN